MEWDNVGVAPPYRHYLIAFRLKAKTGEAAAMVTGHSIKGWLPGKRVLDAELAVPPKMAPGRYELAAGIVDRATKEPAVRLAIAGRLPDGWYPVSEVEVVAPRESARTGAPLG